MAEEENYYALKSHDLRDAERAEIAAKTAEFLAAGGEIQKPAPVEKTVMTVMTKERISQLRFQLAVAQKLARKQDGPVEIDKCHQKRRLHGDITGRRYGMLVVTEREMVGRWVCRCDCGTTCTVQSHRLTKGLKQACAACMKALAKQRKEV